MLRHIFILFRMSTSSGARKRVASEGSTTTTTIWSLDTLNNERTLHHLGGSLDRSQNRICIVNWSGSFHERQQVGTFPTPLERCSDILSVLWLLQTVILLWDTLFRKYQTASPMNGGARQLTPMGSLGSCTST